MHGAGIRHADLHLKNVLLTEEEGSPKLYLLDLDAATISQPLSDLAKCVNLLRLYRSVEKVNRRRTVITRTDALRFLRSYADESSQPIRSLTGRLARLKPFWQLKWKLSDSLGA
jgi:tRNA A-37 threonylcarbamoyl transferase component Bud32